MTSAIRSAGLEGRWAFSRWAPLALGVLAGWAPAAEAVPDGRPAAKAEARKERPDSIPARVAEVMASYGRMGEGYLWPGFEPGTVPIAIYDGEDTWLFRHPSPPVGFRAVPGTDEASVFRGRHEAIRANTSTELGEATTAVMILEGRADESARELAGLLVHEAFHVFQRLRHPGWSGNEVELLVYPVEDSVALGLRRLENEALRSALSAGGKSGRSAAARRALRLREERFARLPSGSVAYERGTELNEGLARYVEGLATGEAGSEILAESSFPPEDVRRRAYATGQALARLLDDLATGWKRRLESDSTAVLDELLRDAVGDAGLEADIADVRPDVEARRSAVATGGEDVRDLQRRRRDRLDDFLGREGWSVEVTAPDALPLWPANFDPLNVFRVDGRRVLHDRWIVLQNDAGRVEVLDRTALTEAATDDHPLFSGVRRLLVTGLHEAPEIVRDDGTVRIDTSQLRVHLEGAVVEKGERRVRIRLPPAGLDRP